MDPRIREDDGRGLIPVFARMTGQGWIPAFARMTNEEPSFLRRQESIFRLFSSAPAAHAQQLVQDQAGSAYRDRAVSDVEGRKVHAGVMKV